MYICKKCLCILTVIGLCSVTLGGVNVVFANPTITTYGYVSNGPAVAGPNASLGEVWWRHGGARLQYDALIGSVQTNSNGFIPRDPANIHTLPPLFPSNNPPRTAPRSRPVNPTPQTSKTPAPQANTQNPASHKLTAPEK